MGMKWDPSLEHTKDNFLLNDLKAAEHIFDRKVRYDRLSENLDVKKSLQCLLLYYLTINPPP